MTLRSLDGGGDPRVLGEFPTGSDTSGGALDVFWSSPTSLTVVDQCHCDAGAGFVSTRALSLKGVLRPIGFMEDHNAFWPDPRSDGKAFAFVHIPSIDCSVSERACENVPLSLAVADLRAQRITTLATRRAQGFLGVRLSPGGTHVAAGMEGSHEIEVYDVSRRKRIATSWFSAASFESAGWVDDARLVAVASSPDLVNDHGTGRLLLITLGSEPSIEPTSLVSGIDVRFLGIVA